MIPTILIETSFILCLRKKKKKAVGEKPKMQPLYPLLFLFPLSPLKAHKSSASPLWCKTESRQSDLGREEATHTHTHTHADARTHTSSFFQSASPPSLTHNSQARESKRSNTHSLERTHTHANLHLKATHTHYPDPCCIHQS